MSSASSTGPTPWSSNAAGLPIEATGGTARHRPRRRRPPGARQGDGARRSRARRCRRLDRALVAESTGKNGKGLIPVDARRGPPCGLWRRSPLRASRPRRPATRRPVASRRSRRRPAGRPPDPRRSRRVRRRVLPLGDGDGVAGAVLGVNPFDQPDVEASKIATRALTDAYERTGRLPEEAPILEDGGIKLFANPANAASLAARAASRASKPGCAPILRARARRLRRLPRLYPARAGDHRQAATGPPPDARRRPCRDLRRLRPRFLHSTGQAYKGGPNTGVFLQSPATTPRISPCRSRATVSAPQGGQARAIFDVLAERGRRRCGSISAATSRSISTGCSQRCAAP